MSFLSTPVQSLSFANRRESEICFLCKPEVCVLCKPKGLQSSFGLLRTPSDSFGLLRTSSCANRRFARRRRALQYGGLGLQISDSLRFAQELVRRSPKESEGVRRSPKESEGALQSLRFAKHANL